MSPLVPVLVMALLMSARLCCALPGDQLAERIQLPAGSLVQNGTTVGMTVEPGEVNESLRPAGPADRSVWYEWRGLNESAHVWISVKFQASQPVRGVAAYTLQSEVAAPVMSDLRPAGASTTASPQGDCSFRLRVEPSQSVIFRIWTVSPSGTPLYDGSNFDLRVIAFPLPERPQGDFPDNPLRLSSAAQSPGATVAVLQDVSPTGMNWLGSEAGENFIGGEWYPASLVWWYDWVAPRNERFQFSLIGLDFDQVNVLVVQQTGGVFDLRAGPGSSAAFDAVAGQRYLVRLAMKPSASVRLTGLFLYGGPTQQGDELNNPAPLSPGLPVDVALAGAGAARFRYERWIESGRADVWFNPGDELSGPYRVEAGAAEVMVYLSNEGGEILSAVAGGSDGAPTAFFAESGKRFIVRVSWPEIEFVPPPCRVVLCRMTATPANDRREGAFPIVSEVTYGDATNATAEHLEDFGYYSSPLGRTVWYYMDDPGTTEPWFAWAWNPGVAGVIPFRQQGAYLVPAIQPGPSYGTFGFNGGRVWFMVALNYPDDRFLLLVKPARSPGDWFDKPVSLHENTPRFLYPGAAGIEPQEPAVTTGARSLWLTWTASSSGLVHLSTLGSMAAPTVNIYTGGELQNLDPLATTAFSVSDYSGRVHAFQSQAGTIYRFQLVHSGSDYVPVVVRLKSGGWESPYDVWRQTWPAWEPVPSLTDPLADTDGDGISNLMEMAVGETRGPVVKDPPGFPWPVWNLTPSLSGLIQWTERTAVLRGPLGCTPCQLTGETSSELSDWDSIHSPAPAGTETITRRYEMRAAPSEPAGYFRLRVHR